MRALLIVAVLCGSARADEEPEGMLAAALVKGDVATLKAAAAFPFYVFGLWFDTAACRRFGGATYTLVSEDDFPALVACIVDLKPRADAEPGTILYGAGSPATVRVQTDHGRSRMRAFMGADPRLIEGDAAPIASAVFGPRTTKYYVPVPRKLQARLDATSTLIGKANLRVCFDRAGRVDAVTILDVGPDAPEFGELSERAARGWKVPPFMVRGKPVRACGTILTAYPGSRLSQSDRVRTPVYPPPPAPPPAADAAPK